MNEKLKQFNVLEHKDNVALFSVKYGTYFVTKKDFYERNISMPDEENSILKLAEKHINSTNKNNLSKNRINTLYYIMTQKCNLNCSFCALRANKDVTIDNELTIEQIKNQVLPKIKELNPRKLILTGGEPLTLERIEYITKLFRNNLDCKIILQSNGLLINTKLAATLKDTIDQIDISTGHMFKNENIYEKLSKNIKLMKQADCNVLLTFIIDNENKKCIRDVIDLAVKYDCNLLLNFVSHVGNALDNDLQSMNSKEKIDVYYEIINYIIDKKYDTEKVSNLANIIPQIRKSCSAFGDMLSILPDGKISMCHNLNDNKFYCGDINKDSVSSIKSNLENSSNDPNVIKHLDVSYIQQCTDCKFKYLCQGSCAAERYWNPGKPIDCDLNKLMITYSLFYYSCKNSTEANLKNFKKLIENEIYTKKTNKLCLN